MFILPPPQATSDPALQGCSLLAVNKKGIAFLDCRTKVVTSLWGCGGSTNMSSLGGTSGVSLQCCGVDEDVEVPRWEAVF